MCRPPPRLENDRRAGIENNGTVYGSAGEHRQQQERPRHRVTRLTS
jgi:hypothetical protein